ncbi:xaa-Pro dipeptidase-like [Triticum dicoccoides]|uniref:xaa-Pro dipeptidase-like n=1 Tax=Triticum dicoccoides TaxID=85692 RepID=UPI00188F8BC3|nr:xaa-Pro dipeptidase-like [Triticum dicoccoides]
MSESSHSLAPPGASMAEVHAGNRERLAAALRAHLTAAGRPLSGIVLLQGGEEQTRCCTDHVPLFRQESYFAYLFGVREPGFYGAVDIASGQSILFAPRLSPDDAIWNGKSKKLPHFKDMYKVDSALHVDELAQVLRCEFSEHGHGEPLLFLLHGRNTDSGNYSRPASFEGMDKFDTDLTTLHPILTECRVTKSDMELALIQHANDVSSEAHVEVMRRIKPGMTENQLESIFRFHASMHEGCRRCAYTCICATGQNSSILHYGQNDGAVNDEYNFYAFDITCSYPTNGKFTRDQAVVYNAALKAHNDVISHMRPGVKWIGMHKLAERRILESLEKEDIIHGDIDDMMDRRLGAVFMPHGLGHLLGIDAHDPGGYPEGLERPEEPGLRSLRTTRELKEGMVITVEPGCYFIDALLRQARNDPICSEFFNWEKIQIYRSSGGVRIESNVYVTAQGCTNLTNCPQEICEIEAVMAGAAWHSHPLYSWVITPRTPATPVSSSSTQTLLTPAALVRGPLFLLDLTASSSTGVRDLSPLADVFINQKVLLILGLNPPNFSQWRTLFEVTFQKYAVLDHISGAPRPTDPVWLQDNAHIVSWLYNRISPEVFGLVHQHGATAGEVWAAICSLFVENREHQVVFQATEFRRLEQGSSSILTYFARLKECADRLADLGSPVDDRDQVEYRALMENRTWRLVPRPCGTNIVTGKWLFRHKLKSDGSLERYKAHWVVRGFSQRPGVDFDETFSPVVKAATIRVVLTIATTR